MNAVVCLFDVDAIHYMRKFNDLKEWVYNHYSLDISYSKKKNVYYCNNQQIELPSLFEKLKEEYNIISYESFRRNDLYKCCNVNYGFEKFLQHLFNVHDLFISVDISSSEEKLFCNSCEFCSILPEELQAHLNVHQLLNQSEILHISDDFHLCDICSDCFELRTFRKNDPLAEKLYIQHLNLHYQDHQVKLSASEVVVSSEYECSCGFKGNFAETIRHFTQNSKIEINPNSITMKSDPELRDTKCSVCLEEYQDIVYKCLGCKNGFCFHKCATEIIRNKGDCPMCRKGDF